MNKDQLASVVAAEVGLSQSDAKKAVEAVFDGITNGMKNGDKVSIAGFGNFESRYRAARQGRNPATGETIQIAAILILSPFFIPFVMPSKTASTAAFASDCDNPTSDATTLANWSLFIAVFPFFNIS